MKKNSKIESLILKYKKLGVKKSQLLYISSDFGKIFSNLKISKDEFLGMHFDAIQSIIGKKGTIVVPTATLNLCGSKKIFDAEKTESFQMGAFSEYVRKKKNSKRSIHPLWSVSAIGKLADYITQNVPQHAFGFDSVFHRLVEKNAYFLSIGINPRLSISLIHYIELVCGVPYRMTKIFKQKIKIKNKIISKNYFHFVLKNRKTPRDKNIKIFNNFKKYSKVNQINLKSGKLTFFSSKEFFKINSELISKRPYIWTKLNTKI